MLRSFVVKRGDHKHTDTDVFLYICQQASCKFIHNIAKPLTNACEGVDKITAAGF